jgi:hypothetical protein
MRGGGGEKLWLFPKIVRKIFVWTTKESYVSCGLVGESCGNIKNNTEIPLVAHKEMYS